MLLFNVLDSVLALAHHLGFSFASFRNFRAVSRPTLENLTQKLGVSILPKNQL